MTKVAGFLGTVFLLLTAACSSGGGPAALAALAGTLDAAFGTAGTATYDGGGEDEARAVAVDAQGRIVLVGNRRAGNDDLLVARLDANGDLDPSFNGTGVVLHAGAAGGDGHDRGYAVAIDGAGRIVVGGLSENAAGDWDIAVWRFLPDGSLDAAFNGVGFVTHDGAAGGNGDDRVFALAIDAAGRILCAGTSEDATGDGDWVVWRFLADGSLDPAFNGTGFRIARDPAGGDGQDQIYGLTLDAAGNILVTGKSLSRRLAEAMVVIRYRPDGTPDPAFATGGVLVYNDSIGINGEPRVIGRSIGVDSRGRIVVVGWTATPTGHTFLWRFAPDGTPDRTFATDGIAVFREPINHNNGRSLMIDAQDRILFTGMINNGTDLDMAVWRYRPDGTPDPSFGAGGVLVHDGGAGDDQGNGIAFDPLGRIVVGGYSENAANGDAAVWRIE